MLQIADVTRPDRMEAVTLLARAGFGPTVEQLVAFPLAHEAGTLLGLWEGDELAAVSGAVSFGTTGWIGALAVESSRRGRGLGAAVCEAAISWLRDRGAETILLYATAEGRPVYAAQGFEAEQPATAWRGTAAVRLPATVRPLRAADRDAVLALDRETTGEHRHAVLNGPTPLRGWAVDGHTGDGLRGAAITSPYSRGASVAARDEEAGLALVASTVSGPATGVILVPDGNEAALTALQRWRFARANAPLRMRLGPAPARRQEQQYGLFNFFWG